MEKKLRKTLASLMVGGALFGPASGTRNASALSSNELVPILTPVVILAASVIPILMIMAPSWFKKMQENKLVSKSEISNDEASKDSMPSKLKQMLKIKVIGQENAKTEIIRRISSFKQNPNPNGALVLCLNGGPGLGKTYCARLIQDALLEGKRGPEMVSRSTIDTFSKKSAVSQIFEDQTTPFGQSNTAVRHPFKVQLQQQSKNTVFIIDEFDKYDPSMQTLFWDASDTGKILAGGQTFDVTGSVFILLSNFSRASLGLTPDPSEKDPSGLTFTIREIPTPFLQRIQPIQFERFSISEFVQIFNFELSKMNQYFKETYNIYTKIPNDILVKWSTALSKEPFASARDVLKKIDEVRYKINQFRIKNKIPKKSKTTCNLVVYEYADKNTVKVRKI
jgi:ATP-dependent Clp protease ATP-binding subunit ClpA